MILYELLTGTTPLERKRMTAAAWDAIRQIIREEEPPRPSARLSTEEALATVAANRGIEPARLGRLVRRDLDWIAMKSLAKERDHRYASANALAEDVQRYLRDEPVNAGPPTLRYRMGKFVRRHRSRVALADALSLQGKDKDAERIYRDDLAAFGDPADPPPQRLVTQYNLAGLLAKLSRHEEAEPLMRQVYQARLKMFGAEAETTTSAAVGLGSTLSSQRKYLEALPLLEEALRTLNRTQGEDGRTTLHALHNFSACLRGLHRYEEAAAAGEQVLRLREKLFGPPARQYDRVHRKPRRHV